MNARMAMGRAIAVLATVTVEGVEPCLVVVVHRAGDRDPLVAGFVTSARTFLASPRTAC
ncbi:hypothetical protein ACU635_03040 [[Actinomadura] parvosata]|uniref:hypothetical protein n=1 Tax=[Actinomadura] parvosata TaxID=1955412 RepID=UPI00406BFC4E